MTHKIIYKVLTLSDWKILLDFLLWLTPEAYELWHFYGKSFDKKKVMAILASFDDIKIGLIENGKIITFGHLYKFTNESCRLGIVSAITGKGYGSRMMYVLIDTAKVLGVKNIYLSTYKYNPQALALYKKFGFKIIKEHTDRPRIKYEMEIELK